jgi:hypothetical protein
MIAFEVTVGVSDGVIVEVVIVGVTVAITAVDVTVVGVTDGVIVGVVIVGVIVEMIVGMIAFEVMTVGGVTVGVLIVEMIVGMIAFDEVIVEVIVGVIVVAEVNAGSDRRSINRPHYWCEECLELWCILEFCC